MTFPREGKFTSSHFFASRDVMGMFNGNLRISNLYFLQYLLNRSDRGRIFRSTHCAIFYEIHVWHA